jgi:hypothetical protein
MLAASALTLVLVAVPLQLLGLGSTCTQGADGTFITGALLSSPLLLVAAVFLAVVALRRPEPSQRMLLWASGIAAVAMPIFGRDVWLNSLIYGTPCGRDFVDYGESYPVVIGLIVAAYLVLPGVVAALSGFAVARRR